MRRSDGKWGVLPRVDIQGDGRQQARLTTSAMRFRCVLVKIRRHLQERLGWAVVFTIRRQRRSSS